MIVFNNRNGTAENCLEMLLKIRHSKGFQGYLSCSWSNFLNEYKVEASHPTIYFKIISEYLISREIENNYN